MQRAKELDISAISTTDHGSLSGHREFYFAAQKHGLKPILGLEAYISSTDRFDKRASKARSDGTSVYNHITLLAANDNGLNNINRLSELAWTEGYYFKPRIDSEILYEYSDDVIVLSGCLNGLICKALEAGDEDRAIKIANEMKSVFGDRFFIEVQSHNPPEVNHALLAIADKLDIPPAMASDCHYANPQDLWIEEAMLILATNPKVNPDADMSKAQKMDILDRFNYLYPDRPMSFKDLQLYLRSSETEQQMFAAQGIDREDIYKNTHVIADMVSDYDMPRGLDLLPVPKTDANARLDTLVQRGLKRRGLADISEYQQRAEEELALIKTKNFASYFLIIADMIVWGKKQGILFGPGRGSAAGSLVLYAIGATEVDPLKYNLLFSRFLNMDRNDWPDVDQDIEDERRSEVKDYLVRKFKNVASISTFSYFKDKGVVRDASRALAVPLGDVNRVLKNVNSFEEFESSPDTLWFRDKYPDVAKLARALRGRIRSAGMHAAGLVVSKNPINLYAPIETRKDDSDQVSGRIPVVGYDMDTVADIGLIKFDLLGLKTLAVINDTLKDIEARHGRKIELTEIDLDDPAVLKDLSNGFTKAVFQAEAAPFTALLKRMGVEKFDHVVAANALVRPGAMDSIGDDFIARKQGRMSVPRIHPIYDDITSETYGSVLYQEQVMLLCNKLAVMSWSDADKIRKIIGKKKDVHEFDQYRDQFIEGASKHVTKEFAEKLWHDFEAHANYSFNKCTSGNTLLRRAASGRYTKDPDIKIKDLYYAWHSDTPTGYKYRTRGVKVMALDSDGRVRPQRIKAVYENGIKETFRVTLSNGAFIDATENHRHLTADGYKPVADLAIGDTMYYSDYTYEPTFYQKTIGSGWGKSAERAMAADGRMRPSLGGYHAEYVRNVTSLTDECAFCGATEGRLEVAHLNSNNKDNRLENLARLCNSCHKKLDYKFGSRKKRHSKGYSVSESTVVSIESNGYEMTYDVEMDTEEHNWLGNGIVTHNSHSVAYSMLSMWTAWLKHYYPLEFMAAALKHEAQGPSSMRTDYLIETKRLGLKVMMPHVNKSQLEFGIDGNDLRFGFTDVKFISKKVGKNIMKLAPFDSYHDFVSRSAEKGTGVNSRAVGALTAIGAATFDDNPLRGDEKDYFYEYIGIPTFNVDALPEYVEQDRLADYEEGGQFIFVAMAKSIKKGKGWSRVEMVDETGSAGIFHSENTQIQPGRMYLILVSDNRIMRYIDIDEIDDIKSDPLLHWLRADELNIPHDKKVVIAFSARDTKAGKKMATVVLSKKDKKLESVLVFPKQFPRALGLLKPGSVVSVNIGTLDDGTRFIRQIGD